MLWPEATQTNIERPMTKPKKIVAWAIANHNGVIYHHDFRQMLSIYATQEEANKFVEPKEDERVVEVEITISELLQ
jgi:hypothetical protein